jgi:hypothetical protein
MIQSAFVPPKSLTDAHETWYEHHDTMLHSTFEFIISYHQQHQYGSHMNA